MCTYAIVFVFFIMALVDKCILVSRITDSVSTQDLLAGFRDFGTVDHVVWRYDHRGKHTGHAIIVYQDPAHASLAVTAKKKDDWEIAKVDVSEEELKSAIKDKELEDVVKKTMEEFTPAAKERVRKQ